MTTALLYFATAALLTWLGRRLIAPFSSRAQLLLVLLPLLFTGRAILTGAVYAPIDLPYLTEPLKATRAEHGITDFHNGMLSDVYSLNIPWKAATRAAWAHGWPLWNPFSFCGDILAASAQPTPYEPLFLLSLLLPLANSLTFLAAITFFVAGLLMFLFLRELRCSEVASLGGAVAWMFCTFLVFWLEWVITPTTLWLPLVLLAVRRIVRRRDVASAGLLTFAFVMMLLNGHPESALHIVAIGMVWALAELRSVRFAGFVRAALSGGGAGLVALLLTAIYMLPVIEAIPQTAEQRYRQEVYARQPRSVTGRESLQRLSSSFVPFRFGAPNREWPADPPFAPYPESASCGSAALALAAFGLWRSRWRGRWFVFALVAGGLVFAINLAPFADWLAKLPLFDIALNGRLAMVAAFGIAVLAALGIDALVAEERPVRLAVAALAVTIALGAVIASQWSSMIAWKLTPAYLRTSAAFLLIPPVAIAMAALVARRNRRAAAALVVTIVALQRMFDLADFYPTLPAAMFYPRLPLLSSLPKTDEPYRIVGTGSTFIPNTAAVYGLEDVRGYQAMTFAPMRESQPHWSFQQPVWFNRIDDLARASTHLSAMNVRFAIADDALTPPEGWREVAHVQRTKLFENSRVAPRAFIPANMAVAADPVREWGDRLFDVDDFQRWSWVEVPGAPASTAPNGTGRVTIRRDGYNAFDLDATLDSPAWIVISEMAWKGWRAYSGGEPVKVRRANHALLGIYLDRGHHAVRLQYLPHSFVVGRAISVATLVLLALTALVTRSRRAAAS